MTRRALFATLAAVFAGRKIAPAVPLPAPSEWDDVFLQAMLPAIDEVVMRKYVPMTYGLGFKVSKSLWGDDAIHCRVYQRAVVEQERREEGMAEMFRHGFRPSPIAPGPGLVRLSLVFTESSGQN